MLLSVEFHRYIFRFVLELQEIKKVATDNAPPSGFCLPFAIVQAIWSKYNLTSRFLGRLTIDKGNQCKEKSTWMKNQWISPPKQSTRNIPAVTIYPATVNAVCTATCKSIPFLTNIPTQAPPKTRDSTNGSRMITEIATVFHDRTNSRPSSSAFAISFCVTVTWPVTFSGSLKKAIWEFFDLPRTSDSILLPSPTGRSSTLQIYQEHQSRPFQSSWNTHLNSIDSYQTLW